MRLVWAVIQLVLIFIVGIVGVQESSGNGGGVEPDPRVCGDRLCSEIQNEELSVEKETWHPLKNIQETTYLHYEICHYEDNQCNPITMYHWVKPGINPKVWYLETTILEDRKESRGTMLVDKETNELRVFNNTIFQDYRDIMQNSIGLFSNLRTHENSNEFHEGGEWVSQTKSNLNSTTFQISKSELTILFNNATNYSLTKIGDVLKENGTIWINEEIPFPIKANYTINNSDVVEKIEFELIEYAKSTNAPDFLNYDSRPGDYLEFNMGTRIMKISAPSGSLPLPEPIGPTSGIWVKVSTDMAQSRLKYISNHEEYSYPIPPNSGTAVYFDEAKTISDVRIYSNSFWKKNNAYIEIQYLAPGQTISQPSPQNELPPPSTSTIGEIYWYEASYPTTATGKIRVIDPDMNLHPKYTDNFPITVWSDSDTRGIELTVHETDKESGIFEGSVFFTTSYSSSGQILQVKNGDTITAKYVDKTLPEPHSTTNELDITATTLSGTISPIFRGSFSNNLRIMDLSGNSLDSVSVDQQVRISSDLANGYDVEQPFTYLLQIQDGNGVTVSLAWIEGSLSAGQSFSPGLSWIPPQMGTYTATAFHWISVDNPTSLSPPVSTTINVK